MCSQAVSIAPSRQWFFVAALAVWKLLLPPFYAHPSGLDVKIYYIYLSQR